MSHGDPFCPRTITFLIPGNPSVQVTAVEDSGSIVVTVDVLNTTALTADLRGLFFHLNQTKMSGLQITGGGGWITGTQVQSNSVIDLLDGVNMSGAAAPFDVGIKFGTAGLKKDDINFPVEFTLTNTAGNLTLDDIAHQEFGARLTSIGGPGGPRGGVSKITTIAPAAPDAEDDSVSMFEDGASGLNDPLTIPIPNLFNVLANDTDLDGDTLSVFAFHDGPAHGKVTVAADGNVLYTPDEDYSGTDSFVYCVSDGNGGQDSATVTIQIEAVADKPSVVWQARMGATVNEIILTVTAEQTDFDSSEFIDRIEISGLPPGVTADLLAVNPTTELDRIVQDFLITVPPGVDTKFDLAVTAVSKETSNGDEQSETTLVPIEMDFTHNETNLTFQTNDQDIWASGDAFKFEDNRFIGINENFDLSIPFFIPPDPIPFVASAEGHLKAGFQSHLFISGGEIDATLPFDVSVDTHYNKTTDSLLIDSTAVLASGGTFSTTGPEGFYKLNFIFDFLLEAGIEFPIDLTTTFEPDPINEELIDFDSGDAKFSFPLPIPGAELTIEWPHINTTGSQSGSTTLSSTGTSNNFLDISLDVDQFAGSFFAPLLALDSDPTSDDNFEWLDLDVNGGLNFIQEFIVSASGMTGTITFENGTTQAYSFLTDLLIQDASSLDADQDDQIEFVLTLTPDATLSNDTDLGLNVGYSFDLLKNIPIVDETLFHSDGNATIPAVDIYNDTFALAGFNSQQYGFFA